MERETKIDRILFNQKTILRNLAFGFPELRKDGILNEGLLKAIKETEKVFEEKPFIDYSKKEVNNILRDIENRIKLCLKSTNKDKEKGMPPGMDWKSEALGYKTSLECVQRTREKFGLNETSEVQKR